MTAEANLQVVLARRPVGVPVVEDFGLRESAIPRPERARRWCGRSSFRWTRICGGGCGSSRIAGIRWRSGR